MEDQYVVLLQKVVAENVRLREVIEARDNEQRQMFEDLASKIALIQEPGRKDRVGKEGERSLFHSNAV